MTDQNSNVNLGLTYEEYRNYPSISNSDLKYIKSPRKFIRNKTSEYIEEDKKSYQELGTLIDLYFLDREKFNEQCFVQTETISKPTSQQQVGFADLILSGVDEITAYRANYSCNNLKDDKVKEKAQDLIDKLTEYIDDQKAMQEYTYYCDAKNWLILTELEFEIQRNDAVKELLNPDSKDKAVFSHLKIVDVPYKGLNWKGEIDRLIIDFAKSRIYIVDLKSTNSMSGFPYSYKKYRYYRQQALYEILVRDWVVKQGIIKDLSGWLVLNRIVALETTPMFESAVFPIPDNVIAEGVAEIDEAANTLVWHFNNDAWDYPRSYYENKGLILVDWDNVFDFTEPTEDVVSPS